MKAVLLFDDYELLANAAALLHLLASAVEDEAVDVLSWATKPYRLDLLKRPAMAEEILTEAVDADLIVFALNKTETLPPWMMHWLKNWAARRRINDPAFVVLGRGADTDSPSAAARELRQFARHHALGCVFDDGSFADANEWPAKLGF